MSEPAPDHAALIARLRRHREDILKPGGTNASDLRDDLNLAADALRTANRPEPIASEADDRPEAIGLRHLLALAREMPNGERADVGTLVAAIKRDVPPALAALRGATRAGWRPIETAPRRDSDVLVLCAGNDRRLAGWHEWNFTPEQMRAVPRDTPNPFAGWVDDYTDEPLDPQPTHWFDVPAPPEATE